MAHTVTSKPNFDEDTGPQKEPQRSKIQKTKTGTGTVQKAKDRPNRLYIKVKPIFAKTMRELCSKFACRSSTVKILRCPSLDERAKNEMALKKYNCTPINIILQRSEVAEDKLKAFLLRNQNQKDQADNNSSQNLKDAISDNSIQIPLKPLTLHN